MDTASIEIKTSLYRKAEEKAKEREITIRQYVEQLLAEQFAADDEAELLFGTDTSPLLDRARKAAKGYLFNQGFNIEALGFRCEDGRIDIVAKDTHGDYRLVFVTVSENEPPLRLKWDTHRKQAEKIALAYLADTGIDIDRKFQFDHVHISSMGDSKAMLMHHQNVLGDSHVD